MMNSVPFMTVEDEPRIIEIVKGTVSLKKFERKFYSTQMKSLAEKNYRTHSNSIGTIAFFLRAFQIMVFSFQIDSSLI